MAHIVVLGAGLGGTIMAYEMKDKLRSGDTLTVITKDSKYHFVPSNPWVAVGWRKQGDVEIDLAPVFAKKGINFKTVPAKQLLPEQNRVELVDGTSVDYDYLINATGPELAFDEIEGLGPEGFTHSVCHVEHALKANDAFQAFCKNPGPIIVGAVQGASCFGPAYEFLFILETELRRRKIRDRVPMTFVTAEPYIGHMGLGGVGDSKGLMESELRQRHINWITNAKVLGVEAGVMTVAEHNEDGSVKKEHKLPFKYSMMLPAFKGVDAVAAVPELCNPRGFVLIDEHQRSKKYPNIYSAGVCVAIPPVEATPVPTGAPKTGYMIESMVRAICENVAADIAGKPAAARATWNAICLADFGGTGAAFVALPQIPPRNVTWANKGKWVHLAKVGFEKYFLRKVKKGVTEPAFEKYIMNAIGITKLKAKH